MTFCVRQRTGRECLTAREMSEIRRHFCVRRCALNRVAHDTRSVQKNLLTTLLELVGGLACGLALRLCPLFVLRRVFRNHQESHFRVLVAAELRALATIDAGLVGAQLNAQRMAGYEILLACEIRDPEAVYDVRRLQLDDDRSAHWNVKLVRGFERLRRVARVVSRLPPPLQATHLDNQA